MIEVGSKVPLSTRVRLVQPESSLDTELTGAILPETMTGALIPAWRETVRDTERDRERDRENAEGASASTTAEQQASTTAQRDTRSTPLASAATGAAVGVERSTPPRGDSDGLVTPAKLDLKLSLPLTPRSSGRRVLGDHVRQTERHNAIHGRYRRAASAPPRERRHTRPLRAAAVSLDSASLGCRRGGSKTQREADREKQTERQTGRQRDGDADMVKQTERQTGRQRDGDADMVSLYAAALREAARAASEAASHQLRYTPQRSQ